MNKEKVAEQSKLLDFGTSFLRRSGVKTHPFNHFKKKTLFITSTKEAMFSPVCVRWLVGL